MRKIILVLNTFILTLCMINFGYALEPNLKDSEQYIQIAKEKIKTMFDVDVDNEKDLKLSMQNIYNDLTKREDTYIAWYKGDNKTSKNYFVCISGKDKKVVSFCKSECEFNKEKKSNNLTKEEAKKIADNYVKKLNLKEFQSTKFIDESLKEPDLYSFRYVRVVDGVEFEEDYICVDVDKNSKNIVYYCYNWNEDSVIPHDENAKLTLEQAKNMFKNNINMKLRYDFNVNSSKEVALAYIPEFKSGNIIDATNSKMLNISNNTDDIVLQKDITKEEKNNILKTNKSKDDNPKSELTKDEAITAGKIRLKEFLNKEKALLDIEYIKDYIYEGNNVWKLYFGVKNDKDSIEDTSMMILDAKSTSLISLYNDINDYENSLDLKFSYEDAYDKAIDYIAKYHTDKIQNISTNQTIYAKNIYNNRYVTFNFNRLENGIEYYNEGISIVVDLKTGFIISVYYNWNEDSKFVNPNNIISENEAKDIFINEYDIKLVYTRIYKDNDCNIKLVYRLEPKDENVYKINAVDKTLVKFDEEF